MHQQYNKCLYEKTNALTSQYQFYKAVLLQDNNSIKMFVYKVTTQKKENIYVTHLKCKTVYVDTGYAYNAHEVIF